MPYSFKERVQQTVVPKKGAYAGKWVRRLLDNFSAKLGSYLKKLRSGFPKKAGGYMLRTSLDAKKPVWKGNSLPLQIRLLVEARHWTGWPDIIEVKINGKLGYATSKGSISKLDFDIQFGFFAKDAALPAIKAKLAEASGEKIQTKEDIRSYLKNTVQSYLQRLKKAVATGVKDFKRLFEEAPEGDQAGAANGSDEAGARLSRRATGRAGISPFSPEALLPGVRLA